MNTAEIINQLHNAAIWVALEGDMLTIDAPAGTLTPELLAEIKERKPEIIEALSGSLEHWIGRVRKAESKAEVFAILADFKPLDWADDQRAQMSQTYIWRLDRLEQAAEGYKGHHISTA